MGESNSIQERELFSAGSNYQLFSNLYFQWMQMSGESEKYNHAKTLNELGGRVLLQIQEKPLFEPEVTSLRGQLLQVERYVTQIETKPSPTFPSGGVPCVPMQYNHSKRRIL